jgi:hypothetical protein
MFASPDYALSRETAPARVQGPSQVMACFELARGRQPLPSPASFHYLAQVLSAFRAVSADANVECAAPTTFTVLPAAGRDSTI